MPMASTFDTLKFANRLKAAGVEPKIAEAHATAEAEIFAENVPQQIATKYDMIQVEDRMDNLEGRMDKLDGKMDKLEGRMDNLEGSFIQLENKLTIKLGGIMTAGIGIIAALLVIFHAG
ncbi:MAG: hypothetical protein KAT71_00870 [Gammaproteobacteria bacterium]|nr:hypothetical protein [Gammaproteobacteria bacterium]